MEWLRQMLYKSVFEHYQETHCTKVVETYSHDIDKLTKDAEEILKKAKLKGPPYRHRSIQQACQRGLPSEPEDIMEFMMWKKVYDSLLFFPREQCDPTNLLNWFLTGRYVLYQMKQMC